MITKEEIQDIYELMGYPNSVELKKHMNKLKKIRKYLDRDTLHRPYKPFPKGTEKPVKKLHENSIILINEENLRKVVLEIDYDKIRSKDYILSILRKIFTKEFKFVIDQKHNNIIVHFPLRQDQEDKIERDRREKAAGNQDVLGNPKDYELVKGLSYRTPQDAIKSVQRVKNADLPTYLKIKSLVPLVNRAKDVIKKTKDPEKRANLIAGFSKIKVYFDNLHKQKEIEKQQQDDEEE